MTRPEINVSRVSLFLRAYRMRINAEHADSLILFRVNPRSSASQIKFGVNYVFWLMVSLDHLNTPLTASWLPVTISNNLFLIFCQQVSSPVFACRVEQERFPNESTKLTGLFSTYPKRFEFCGLDGFGTILSGWIKWLR
jgi:hypothetical protein